MIHDYGDEVALEVDGWTVYAPAGEPLVEVLDRLKSGVAHVCYHSALGPLQTCDTCLLGRDRWDAATCVWYPGSGGARGADGGPSSRCRAARGDAPYFRQPRPLLHHL